MMTQYLLNMFVEYINFVICFIVFVIILASLSRKVRKLVYLLLIMGTIYIALVGLYKCGVGITSLYNFSKEIIFIITIIFKQLVGESVIAGVIVERIINLIGFIGVDNWNMLVILSEFATEITIPYVIATIKSKIVKNKKVFYEENQYCLYSKKIINNMNPIYLLKVSFRN